MKLFLSAVLLLTSISSFAKTTRLITVHSYPPGDWSHGIDGSIAEVLQSNKVLHELKSIVFHAEYWRRKNEELRKTEQDRLVKEITDYKPDVVVLVDDEAADFLASRLKTLNKPIFFTGINQIEKDIPWLKGKDREKFSGVFEVYQIQKGNDLLKGFDAKTRNISVLTSNSATSQILADQFTADFSETGKFGKSGLKLRKIYKLPFWSQWKEAVKEINAKDDAVWILVPYDVRDSNNQELLVVEIGKWLTANLKKPSIGILGVNTRIGLLASVNTHAEGLGKQVAEMIVRNLGGEPLQKIGFEQSRYFKLEVNKFELNRLKLSIPASMANEINILTNEGLKYGR